MSDHPAPEPDGPESPPTPTPELSEADKAMVHKVAGASFGDRALFDLPSGRVVSGAEMRRLISAGRLG